MEYTRPRAKLVTLLGVLELPRWEDVWLAEVCLRISSQLAKQIGKFPETLLFNTRTRPCPLAYSRKGTILSVSSKECKTPKQGRHDISLSKFLTYLQSNNSARQQSRFQYVQEIFSFLKKNVANFR